MEGDVPIPFSVGCLRWRPLCVIAITINNYTSTVRPGYFLAGRRGCIALTGYLEGVSARDSYAIRVGIRCRVAVEI